MCSVTLRRPRCVKILKRAPDTKYCLGKEFLEIHFILLPDLPQLYEAYVTKSIKQGTGRKTLETGTCLKLRLNSVM